MPNSMMDANAYHEQKVTLLRQYVSLSEELLSVQLEDDWPQMDGFFLKRDEVIQQLHNLDQSCDKTIRTGGSDAQNTQIDQLVNLIVEIDKDLARLITEERDTIAAAIKSNTQEQKIADYTSTKNTVSGGQYLDIKK